LIFDIAKVVAHSVEKENLVRDEFRADGNNSHPSDIAGIATAKAFLSWY